MPRTNIILFGEPGGGKSSVVNMLSANESVAVTSNSYRTVESRAFEVDVCGMPATLWDTAGIFADSGRVEDKNPIAQLCTLLRQLSDGVSLLMFVMRGPRIGLSAPANWKLVHEATCQKQVPIMLVITGLEHEQSMDEWWWNNKGAFQGLGINPSGVACVTAWRGKARGGGHIYDEEYGESRDKIRKLIRSTCLTVPWVVPAAQ